MQQQDGSGSRVLAVRPKIFGIAYLVTAAIAAAGCAKADAASSGSAASAPVDVLQGLKAIPTPPGGLALYTPIIRQLQPGADVTHCTYTDVITQNDLFLNTTHGVESSMGHHALLYYLTTPEAPRTEICHGQGMEKMVQILGGSGGEGTGGYQPPANVGATIPKGSQFVIQTHWINTSDKPVDVQAMMVTVPGTDGPDRIETGSLVALDLSFNVPARDKLHTSVECVMQGEHRLFMSIGHEHEWGTHVAADVTRVDGTNELLFDRDFTPHDTFDPPVNDYGVTKPLTFHKGDKLRMQCDWANTTDEALSFPREMCVFFGYTMSPGDVRCINGNWIGAGSSGDGGTRPTLPGPPCAKAGDPGNAAGVGRHCTGGGGECATGGAGICLADYTQGAFGNFCTKLCSDDAACGAGATCTGQPGSATRICMPASCVTGAPDAAVH
jgi:hypothetical protein